MATHAQESKKAAWERARLVMEELKAMKLKEATKKIEDGIEETLTYSTFPPNTGRRSAQTTSLNV